MSRTFNCGIGFVLITSSQNVSAVLGQLREAGESHAAVIGSVVSLNTGVYPTCHVLRVCMYKIQWIVL